MRYFEVRKSPDYDGKRACCNQFSILSGICRAFGCVTVPAVLSTNMSSNAKTCNDVLYVSRLPVEPHCGFGGVSCLRASSACRTSVETSSHDTDAMNQIRPRWYTTSYPLRALTQSTGFIGSTGHIKRKMR